MKERNKEKTENREFEGEIFQILEKATLKYLTGKNEAFLRGIREIYFFQNFKKVPV